MRNIQSLNLRDFYEVKGLHTSCFQSPRSAFTGFRRFRERKLLAILDPLIGSPLSIHSILDVGSEEGFFSLNMAARGIQVTSLDISSNRLHYERAQAQERQVTFCPVQGDGAKLPFADASFDLVLAMDVIEHIPAYEDAIPRVFSSGAKLSDYFYQSRWPSPQNGSDSGVKVYGGKSGQADRAFACSPLC